MPLIGNVDKITLSYIAGWAADSDMLDESLDVLIYVDGEGRGRVKANVPRDDLRTAFPGATGKHAFRFEFGRPLSPFAQHKVSVIDARDRKPLPNGERTIPAVGREPTGGPQPICLTSTGRSGTSLLMGRLAGHPEIAVAGRHPFEVKQLTYHVLALRTMTLAANWNKSMNPEALVSPASHYSIGFNPFHDPDFGDHPLLDEYWQTTAPVLLTAAFRDATLAYYDAVRVMTGKLRIRYFAEKTHPNQEIRDGVAAVFGGVKEIVLVRDPRDLMCSYRAFWKRDLGEAVSLIGSQLSELAQRVRHPDPDTLLMRYEDLIMEPTETLGKVWEFLQLERGANVQQSGESAVFRQHGTSGSPEKSVGRWKHELTSQEVDVCSQKLEPLMTLFGYATC